MNKNETVNLFFACDDGYVPFLCVTLLSIKENRNENRTYHVRILNTGISEVNKKRILESLEAPRFTVEFENVCEAVERISDKLHTRDYYSKTTYYRLFIPELYPDVSKALYLDCDTILESDVAELYDTELGKNLVGAVTDGFVSAVPRLHGYVTERIGVYTPSDYFNAGVLLMNLDEMRKSRFGERFIDLIGRVKFDVAQDQDYLNVLCRGRCKKIGEEWNAMPSFCDTSAKPKLIHFNLDGKPWHKDGLQFADRFWEYADRCAFAEEIREIRNSYRDDKKAECETVNLIDVAEAQGNDGEKNREIREMLRSITG